MTLRFLCLPKGDPQAPLNPGRPASRTRTWARSGADRRPGAPSSRHGRRSGGAADSDAPAADKAVLFQQLKETFNITAVRGPARPKPAFNKAMTESYRALIGDRRRSRYLVDSAEFECAKHQGAEDQSEDRTPPSDSVTWGRVIAFALRQPNLARALGLLVQTTFAPPADFYAAGGWLHIGLHATSDYAADPAIAARYAARIPASRRGAHTISRPFCFPVADVPINFNADDVWREAERYEDGVAKLVHCTQTVEGRDGSAGVGGRQIAEWLNRQVDLDGAGELKIDSPMASRSIA